ncbi:MAG TPA: hypothetical protein VE988_20285 [Gemmataceae bacterium]|nr:hypothetical protein [Gemmataceae bacterium]
MLKRTISLLVIALLWHVAAGSAAAQYYYAAPRPAVAPAVVAPPVGAYPFGYGPYGGGPWSGAADMLDAYGNVGIDMEKARVIREQANQAKLETQKKTVDTVAYERANKYWYTDFMVDVDAKQIQFAMNKPPMSEVVSGRSLNVLLPWLDQLMSKGASGPNIPLDPAIVSAINITSGSDQGNTGVLKELNTLDWPTATIGPDQQKLDSLLKQATNEAMKGQVPSLTMTALDKQINVVNDDVRKRFQKDEVDTTDYLLATRFLDRVKEASKALRQPNVGKSLSGQSGPQGSTVEQVIYSMASKGLQFAPATPGHESDYVALHRAFVNLGLAIGTPDTGFRMRVGTNLVTVDPKKS